MSVLQRARRSQSVLLVALILSLAAGSARTVSAQCTHSTASWKFDEIGYAYHEAFIDGRWQRVYREPRRQAVAWEVSRHLPIIGLPATHDIRRASGVDAFGHCWRRDALGYAYYEIGCGNCIGREYYQPERQSIAAAAHRQLACVDWDASVRQGVAGAMVRGFNAIGVPGFDDATVRSVVSERIVEGLNRAAENTGSGNLSRFQQLVAEGVEDAIVQAFNQMDVTGNGQRAATSHDRRENSSGETSVLSDRRDVDRAPAHVADDVRFAPADNTNADLIGRHYAGGLDPATFQQRYEEARFVDAGWLIGPFGTRPVIGVGMLILSLQRDGNLVEAWQDGILVYSDCHYTEYFEDAQEVASLFPKD